MNRGPAFTVFFTLAIGAAVFFVWRDRQRKAEAEARRIAIESDTSFSWLAGTWKKTEDPDGTHEEWLLFKPPSTVMVTGGSRSIRGTYIAKRNHISVMAAFDSGNVGEARLDASDDRRTLAYESPTTHHLVKYERTSTRSALDTAETKAAQPASARDPSAAPPAEDVSWLIGTWERQSGGKDWLLFNAPKDVMVLAGKPAGVTMRGEFIAHGRFVSLIFREPGRLPVERELEAPPDRSELRENAAVPVTYRRGAPP